MATPEIGEAIMRFEKETRIAALPERVFAFHESAGALERLTPPWERVTLVHNDGSLQPGSRVVMKVRMGGFLPVMWEAEHTEYDPPNMFADNQIRGPFARWYHRHRFLDDGRGGTLLRDEVDFEPPLGALGRWAGGGFLRKKLEAMFAYRHAETRRIVETGDF